MLTVVYCQNRVWLCVSCVQSLKTPWVNDVGMFALDLNSCNKFAAVASLKSVTNVARMSVEYCYACIWLLLWCHPWLYPYREKCTIGCIVIPLLHYLEHMRYYIASFPWSNNFCSWSQRLECRWFKSQWVLEFSALHTQHWHMGLNICTLYTQKCSTYLKILYSVHSVIAYMVRSNTWLTCEK